METRKVPEYLLEMEGIDKTYPNGVQANREVDLRAKRGEIHGLLGENGAGKSTLVKILYGLEERDGGTIKLDGEKREFRSPEGAIRAGIGMVHQHFRLAPRFSVAENVVLGHEPNSGIRFGEDRALEATRDLAEEYGFDLDPGKQVGELSAGKRQYVEILRLLYQGAELLILDEPTAVLTPRETEELMESLRFLRGEGHTILLITHKIEVALSVSDVITVMRDGRIVTGREDTGISEEEVSRLMVDREIDLNLEKEPVREGGEVLRVEGLSTRSEEGFRVLKDVSFSVHGGEIFGVAAVQGNGQSELVEVLAGLRRPTEGEITIEGEPVRNTNPRTMRSLGINHVPEDRMAIGVAGEATVTENLTLPYVDEREYRKAGFLKRGRLDGKSKDLIEEYDVRVQDGGSLVNSLSGGNVQKLILARELSRDPVLLLAAQPTRGLDIRTKRFVWEELLARRSGGSAVLLVSSDLEEVKGLSDRLGVMYEGEIVAVFEEPEELSDEEIGLYMTGVRKGED
ncbi:MAG: ABC transporter ATP-binding protein [Candidatus Bipolaricaulota bacterium]